MPDHDPHEQIQLGLLFRAIEANLRASDQYPRGREAT
jgi:hypothetical protein